MLLLEANDSMNYILKIYRYARSILAFSVSLLEDALEETRCSEQLLPAIVMWYSLGSNGNNCI